MAWNGSNGKGGVNGQASVRKKTKARRPSSLRGVIAGALVVAFAVGAYFVLFTTQEKPQEPIIIGREKPNLKEEAKPRLPKQKAETSADHESPRIGPGEWLGSPVVSYLAVTNSSTGRILETIYTADGKKHKRVSEKSKSPFKNVADDMISMVVSTPPGEVLPPMPMYPGFDDEFRKGLEDDLVIEDDDSDEVKELKAKVLLVREELRERMASGESPRAILSEHEALWNDNIEMRQNVQKEALDLVRSGDMEGARKYVETMNKALESFGIESVVMPGDYRNMSKKEIMNLRKERSK